MAEKGSHLAQKRKLTLAAMLVVGALVFIFVIPFDGLRKVKSPAAQAAESLPVGDDPCKQVTELSDEPLVPRLTAAELELFTKYLNQSKYYFETGSGGSTYIASGMSNLVRIDVVESDINWLNKLRTFRRVYEAECVHKKLRMHFVDINADPKHFGKPLDNSRKSMWPLYAGAISLYVGSPWKPKPDLVFVDARFRIANAVYAYRVLDDDAIIMIHDYHRPSYKKVEKILDKVEQANTLAVFKLKPRTEATLNAAEELLVSHGDSHL